MSSALPVSVNAQPRPPRRQGFVRFGMGDRVLAIATLLVFLFLYLPLVVVVVYSFSSAEIAVWPIAALTSAGPAR